ncbi:uncharacterized protein LOC126199309 [Schistocerca nitens]|uniref:uncharacterized protein LOC126199309 n=1 Tax=Schistocerca nitens TaxID=7011 RepID=UPI0021173850|nr:uncharacterized protein LOC126199309 [Schistocerca nitens]
MATTGSSGRCRSPRPLPLLLSLLLALADLCGALAARANSTAQVVSGTSSGKPTKYHYYPHNQHVYLLPECATQQVCNAVFVRLKMTQPLCACPTEPCSASLEEDDQHTTPLISVDENGQRKALTLAKTCEPVRQIRLCRPPRDWALLALQNVRTGKSHYLVVCRCPDPAKLEGPVPHEQPTYASVPGIRVYGMTCAQEVGRRGRPMRFRRSTGFVRHITPFPWHEVERLMERMTWKN